MLIPCVACQFLCELDKNYIKPTGRLVRCPECDFIFMVSRPSFAKDTIVQDTHIDQSILNDLYSIRPKPQAELPVDELFEEFDDYDVPSLTSVEDFGEEAKRKSNSNTEEAAFADLPDLSEHENKIDWNDRQQFKLRGVILF